MSLIMTHARRRRHRRTLALEVLEFLEKGRFPRRILLTSQAAINTRQCEVGFTLVRIQLLGCIEIRKGFVWPASRERQVPKLVVRLGKRGVKFERRFQLSLGLDLRDIVSGFAEL